MAQAAVVAAVLARLASNPIAGLPVASINAEADTPADGSPFLDVQFPVANEQLITIGSPGSNVYRETGAIRFVLSIQRGEGVTQGLGWADQLRTLFRGAQFATVNTWAPTSPVLDDSNDNGSYWKLTFAVPYYFDFLG